MTLSVVDILKDVVLCFAHLPSGGLRRYHIAPNFCNFCNYTVTTKILFTKIFDTRHKVSLRKMHKLLRYFKPQSLFSTVIIPYAAY